MDSRSLKKQNKVCTFLQKNHTTQWLKTPTGGDRNPCGGSIQILGNNLWQETVIHPVFKTLEKQCNKTLQLLCVVAHTN